MKWSELGGQAMDLFVAADQFGVPRSICAASRAVRKKYYHRSLLEGADF